MKRAAKTYVDISKVLASEIFGGKYAARGSFPSLTRIVSRFKVSRPTAVRVVDDLKRKGLVSIHPGSGTFVTRQALTRKIGILVPGARHSEFFPSVCREISRLAQQEGLTLVFGEIPSDDPEVRVKRAKKLARQFVDEGVSGVVLHPVEFLEDAERRNREILAIFDAAKVPVVLVDCDIVASPGRSEYDVAGIDNFSAGWRMAEHLVASGAKRLAFVRKPGCATSVQNRFNGMAGFVRTVPGGRLSMLSVSPSDLAAVRSALSRRPRPDAIVCRNDHQAALLLHTLRKLGKRVPEDVLVMGCNDADYAAVLDPSLTTVSLPREDIARTAFDLLVGRMAEPTLPPRMCHLPAPLVVRESTQRATGKRGKWEKRESRKCKA